MDLTNELKQQCIFRMKESTGRIEKCVLLLTNEQVWNRPNTSTNSIGHLILHLCGNITQYIQSSLGNQKDNRNRDLEFESTVPCTNDELIQKMQITVNTAVEIIEQLNEAELLQNRSVQGFGLTGIGNIIHVVEHYSYHTGQIALLTKLIKNQDLGFYADFDLNQKNK